MPMTRTTSVAFRWCTGVWLCLCGALLAGCSEGDMVDQPRFKPHAETDFFRDGMANRPIVPGTVARGQLRTDRHLYAGLQDGQTAREFPFLITYEDVRRGQEQYNIYCAVCHGQTGYGDGMIVRRGFAPPPSLHIDRLRDQETFETARPGHVFNVITNGFGAMYSYNDRIVPADRWRIAAYVKALQHSQNPAVPVNFAASAPAGGAEDQQPAQR
jgi:mono/diheme cytochrome c family protein